MIHVFFDCGSFGSTVEYAIRNFSNYKLGPVDASILTDGSMHSFSKQQHITSWQHLSEFLTSVNNVDCITTPTYPFAELKLPEILKHFSTIPTWDTDTKILIYQPNLRAAEINLLFKYHKVCHGSQIQTGIGIIVGNNKHNLSGWDPHYDHWSQMQRWQLREWLSIFYPDWVTEFIESCHQVDNTWLKITNTELLFNTKQNLHSIISWCGLTITKDIDDFVNQWQSAQKYVVDEFNLLDTILDFTLSRTDLEWKPINIIAESILQQRLRQFGFEIRCDGLNDFPTNSKQLYKLLEKV